MQEISIADILAMIHTCVILLIIVTTVPIINQSYTLIP
jgi:hypothetical protein